MHGMLRASLINEYEYSTLIPQQKFSSRHILMHFVVTSWENLIIDLAHHLFIGSGARFSKVPKAEKPWHNLERKLVIRVVLFTYS